MCAKFLYLCVEWCLCKDVSVQMFRFNRCSHRHSLQRATNNPQPLISHTQPLQSVSASPLTSQGCCLCTVLLCHRRLVPLGLCTLIPLPFLGAGPVFSQGSFLCEPARPLSLSGCHSLSLCTHTEYHGPQVWKPQNKRASSLFWGMLRDVQVSEDIKERTKKCNNYIIGQSSGQKLCLRWYKASEGLFTLHDIASPLWKSGSRYCFSHISENSIIHLAIWIIHLG